MLHPTQSNIKSIIGRRTLDCSPRWKTIESTSKYSKFAVNNPNNKYEIYWCGNTLKKHHGVGIVVKVAPNIDILEIYQVNSRIIVIDVIVSGCSLRVINCYAPTEESAITTKNLFYRTLKKQIITTNANQKVICLGDFNATTSASLYSSSLRENSVVEDLVINDNGERFHDLFQSYKLSVLNTWFNHKLCRRYTWHSPDGNTRKVYDFILCCSWLRQYCMNCRVYNSYDFDSDHRLVIAKLSTPCTKMSRYKKHRMKSPKKRFDFKSLNRAETEQNFKRNLSIKLEYIQPEMQSNTQLNEHFITSIQEAADETIPKIVARKLHQPWHEDNISLNSELNDAPPTVEEIQKHLQKLKNNKASNDIEPELLKRCTEPIMLQVIQRMMFNLWDNLDIPGVWGNSRLKTLWKGKGSKKDPTKYRGISIGSTVCKLAINMILERLRPWYENQLSDEQNGFRKDRGTTDGIYTVKRVHQISNKKSEPTFLLFVDLSAAFDHIPRSWLFESIKLRFPDRSIPRTFEILQTLYENTTLTYDDAMISFKTTSGVRQGGPESPFLFNLYLDFVMRVFIEKCKDDNRIKYFKHKYRVNPQAHSRAERFEMRASGIRTWGEATLSWCGYADDIVLFLLSLEGISAATELLDLTFTAFGLTINVSKTETMTINQEQHLDSIISLREEQLKNVKEFKYLGAVLNHLQPNTGEAELNQRIQLAIVKFAQMSNLLQNFQINLRVRIFFLNSFVRSRLTYSCQNWNLTSLQYDRLDVTYRMFLRRMVRGGFRYVDEVNNDFRYVISNNQLHTICGTSDVNVFIKQQQRNYAAHVVRMPSGRLSKLLMFNDDKNCKRGRISLTLLDQVIKNENCSIEKFCGLAIAKKNAR
ncbi:uncharacterized protein [Clytia hemisphaerica]|uniref:uncharacterized protein n=1 Tax=Clytia hemisphaerica TaxID=252671 RepID=UPI0034D45DF5